MDLHFKSAAEIARLIRERKISAEEILERFLTRVEKYNRAMHLTQAAQFVVSG
jgi:Asp-tRNA(Asn)/Glu-tRNA(Gln) amidotransferase A subunit family amidase